MVNSQLHLFSNLIAERYKADKGSFSTESYNKLHVFLEESIGAATSTLGLNISNTEFCGYAFKKGDIVYRCKECSHDPTCVLCADCFNEDNHVGHETTYSITCTTGGCCDCGDAEAWNNTLTCKIHPNTAVVDQLESLPFDIAVVELLSKFISLFPLFSLCYRNKKMVRVHPLQSLINSYIQDDGYYATLLYNDELHSFTEVISLLSRTYKFPKDKGEALAATIDQRGRALVYLHNQLEDMEGKMQMVAESGLRLILLPSNLVYIEEVCAATIMLATQLLKGRPWLQFALSRALVEGVCDTNWTNGHQPDYESTDSLFAYTPAICHSNLHNLVAADCYLWKEIRVALKSFFMKSFLKFYKFKLQLAIAFSDLYPFLLRHFLNDDVEAEYSMVFFSVQLYTVPSIAMELIVNRDILCKILQHTIDGFRPAFGTSSFNTALSFIRNRRYFHPFQDLRYLIEGITISDMSELQQQKFCIFLYSFLDLFSELDPNYHSTSRHLEFESDDWIHAFNISLQVAKLTLELSRFLAPTAEVGTKMLSYLLREVNLHQKPQEDSEVVPVIGGKFSFHHPIQWLFSNLIKWIRSKFVFPPTALGGNSLQFDYDNYRSCISSVLVKPVIDLQVYLGQIRANLWVRNGLSLKNQVHNYLGMNLIEDMRDVDLYLIFEFLSINPSPYGLQTLVKAFNFDAYLSVSNAQNSSITADTFKQAYYTQLDQFFSLLLIVSSFEISSELSEEMLRRALVHVLFLSPMKKSDLVKKLPGKFVEDPSFKHLLDRISVRSDPSTQCKFQLSSDTSTSEIDIFYPYYSHSERVAVLEKIRKLGKKTTFTKEPFNSTHFLRLLLDDSFLFAFILKVLLTYDCGIDSEMILFDIAHILYLLTRIAGDEEMLRPRLLDYVAPKDLQPSIYSILLSYLSNQNVSLLLKGTLGTLLREIDMLENNFTLIPIDTKGVVSESLNTKKVQANRRKLAIIEKFSKKQRSFMIKHNHAADELCDHASITNERSELNHALMHVHQTGTTNPLGSNEDDQGVSVTLSLSHVIHGEPQVQSRTQAGRDAIDSFGVGNDNDYVDERNLSDQHSSLTVDSQIHYIVSGDPDLDEMGELDSALLIGHNEQENEWFDDIEYDGWLDNHDEDGDYGEYGFGDASEPSIETGSIQERQGNLNEAISLTFAAYGDSYFERENNGKFSFPLLFLKEFYRHASINNLSSTQERLLGPCSVCHEQLDPCDQTKVIGQIISMSKERFFRSYSEDHTRNIKSDPHNLLFLSKSAALDAWKYENTPSYFYSACGHLFHYSCLLAKNQHYLSCPLCRSKGFFIPFIVNYHKFLAFISSQSEPDVLGAFTFDHDDIKGLSYFIQDKNLKSVWNGYLGHFVLFFQNEGFDILSGIFARVFAAYYDAVEAKKDPLFETSILAISEIVKSIEISTRLPTCHAKPVDFFKLQIRSQLNIFHVILALARIYIFSSSVLHQAAIIEHSMLRDENLPALMRQQFQIFFGDTSSFLHELIGLSMLFYSTESPVDRGKFRIAVAFLFVKYLVQYLPALGSLKHCPRSDVYLFLLVDLRFAFVFESMFFGPDEDVPSFSDSLEEFEYLYRHYYAISSYWIEFDALINHLNQAEELGRYLPVCFSLSKWQFDMEKFPWITTEGVGEAVTPRLLPYPFLYSFVELPSRFDHLIRQSTSQSCKRCNLVPSDTAICFVCGRLLCFNSHCCLIRKEIGECNHHMLTSCCGSVGLFLLVQKAGVLYLASSTAWVRDGIYVDAYGEPDLGFKRGSALFLSVRFYRDLEREWLLHRTRITLELQDDMDPSALSVIHSLL